jgi:predicted  nucleic acid-binding Zn-ribbon protein
MSVTTTNKPTVDVDVDKTGSTVAGRFTIKNLPSFDVTEATKPLFAFVGVADLAIEQAKDVPADVTARVSKVQARLSEVPAQVKTLPTQVKTLSDDLTEKATDLYTQLTLRGERLVTQIRRQPATEAAIAEGKEAVRKAEAAAIAAKKSAKAGERAVEDAAAKIG